MAMLCIEAFTKYCVIDLKRSSNESELARGFIKCTNKMCKPRYDVCPDGETGIRNSGLLETYKSRTTVQHTLPLSPILFSPREFYYFHRNAGLEHQTAYAMGRSDIRYPSNLQQQNCAFSDSINAKRSERTV